MNDEKFYKELFVLAIPDGVHSLRSIKMNAVFKANEKNAYISFV